MENVKADMFEMEGGEIYFYDLNPNDLQCFKNS